jgi:hypothetical protein
LMTIWTLWLRWGGEEWYYGIHDSFVARRHITISRTHTHQLYKKTKATTNPTKPVLHPIDRRSDHPHSANADPIFPPETQKARPPLPSRRQPRGWRRAAARVREGKKEGRSDVRKERGEKTMGERVIEGDDGEGAI